MWVEQAIFTSLPRRGRGGYHLVSRSPGVTEADATTIASWAPTHGSLIVDASNRTSVNFHPLPSGRLALSRTCEGPAEYSGRGERQVYTHALIVDGPALRAAGSQPIALYRDAAAQGHLRFRPEPEPILQPVGLGTSFARRNADFWAIRAHGLGLPGLDQLKTEFAAGRPIRHKYAGDRIAFIECLLGLFPAELIPVASFSTSLQPSAVRPYNIILTS